MAEIEVKQLDDSVDAQRPDPEEVKLAEELTEMLNNSPEPPKPKAKAKSRAKKAAVEPVVEPVVQAILEQATPQVKPKATRKVTKKEPPPQTPPPPPAPQHDTISAFNNSLNNAPPGYVPYPSTEQIAMYIQNQKMLKVQRKQNNIQRLMATAF